MKSQIVNKYVKSRFEFYKDRFPVDVAQSQARYEFNCLMLRLKKEKVPYRIIATRFGISVSGVREAYLQAKRRENQTPPIEHYFSKKNYFI